MQKKKSEGSEFMITDRAFKSKVFAVIFPTHCRIGSQALYVTKYPYHSVFSF